ncbi:MAG: hypothetical protein KJ558_10220 [Gammaproteobacteria bacterium]|nr:hypothetical protein [Gammaproteobacteria bacterium]MBU1655182.1 hypothetical protein [Gammaproteobacteria bacterium]MBU1959993.1 hypothetical protein [Gammaproteobacteria bacterium]
MNKQFWKEFFTRLDSFETEKLIEEKRGYLRFLEENPRSELRGDLKRMVRLIDEEIISRSELRAREQR